ncbi:MAG: TolC family outer membrane protein [Marinagarivorans sp.]|nr:TolC family outer membrane protein [Marinagarivorans sp.]
MPTPFFSSKKLATLISAAFIFSVTPGMADSLSDIYQLALQNDATFKLAEANLAAGQLNTNVGRASLLPQINGSASYKQSDGAITQPKPNLNNKTQTMSYGVSLSQPLFDAAAWYNYQLSKSSVDVSETDFKNEQQALILRAATAYFAALKGVDDLSTAMAEENALSSSLEQTKQRFQVGLTAITEVHEAQAAYDSARANRLIQEGALAISFEGLEVLTGKNHNALAPLKNDFPVTSPIPAERISWEEIGKNHNLDMIRANYSLDLAKADYKVKRSGHLPTLSANLGYDKSTTDSEKNNLALPDSASNGTSANLTLNVPIFSGGRVSAQRQQAASRQLAASEIVNQTQRRVLQDIRTQYQLVTTGVATIKARQQAIVSSESALQATKAGYDVGTRNLVNLLDAQRKVYAAKRDYLSALYDYVLSGLRLKQSAGTLAGEDVAQLDQWLNKAQLVGPSKPTYIAP